MAKKLPKEFTKFKPIVVPSRMMYVRIEALIPVFDGDGGSFDDEIQESVESATDALACYGHSFVTEQYEIEEGESAASAMLKDRRRNGDLSGEI